MTERWTDERIRQRYNDRYDRERSETEPGYDVERMREVACEIRNDYEAQLAKLRAENERLRALLPDLLAALEEAVALANIADDWHLEEVEINGEQVRTFELWKKWRAIIAKAKGE